MRVDVQILIGTRPTVVFYLVIPSINSREKYSRKIRARTLEPEIRIERVSKDTDISLDVFEVV